VDAFCGHYGVDTTTLARLAERTWPTAASWRKGQASPILTDLLRIVRRMRAEAGTRKNSESWASAQLNDFDRAEGA
jgi:hypothetical protein